MDSMNLLAADHVAPFPDSGDLIFAAGLLSNHHNPQKLIPIRSIPPPPPPPGFPSHHSPLPPSIKVEDPSGSGSGHSSLPLCQEPGSSSDDVGNSSANTKEFGSRKRRRKSSRKLEDFAANLVKKMAEKQEQMHKELVEMIERMEKERIKREEAWKREEMERNKQDEEARAAERSRSLALISLIQKLLGYEIQIPPPAEGSGIREEDEVEVNNNNNSPPLTHNVGSAEVNNNTNSLALIQYVGPAEVSNNKKHFNSGDPSNNRWPDVEVQALIAVRTALEHKFGHMGSKGSIWEEIAGALQGMGYNRSAKKCKEKWENINKYYRRTVGSGKKRPVNSKTCPYFDELDNLYRNGSLERNGNALSNTNNVSIREEKEQGEI